MGTSKHDGAVGHARDVRWTMVILLQRYTRRETTEGTMLTRKRSEEPAVLVLCPRLHTAGRISRSASHREREIYIYICSAHPICIHSTALIPPLSFRLRRRTQHRRSSPDFAFPTKTALHDPRSATELVQLPTGAQVSAHASSD